MRQERWRQPHREAVSSDRGPRPASADGDAGAVAAEFAVVLPVLMLLLVGVFQFAAWNLASEVALGAAQQGARAARVRTGSAEAGRAAAWRFIQQADTGHLREPQVHVDRGTDDVRV